MLDEYGKLKRTPATPSSLIDAIDNGILAARDAGFAIDAASEQIEQNVRDFLAQRFGVYTLGDEHATTAAVMKLWREIFPTKGGSK